MKLQYFQPTIYCLEEPSIEVGDNIALPDQKMGLTLFGPLGNSSRRYEINIGLIGDANSIERTKDLFQRMNITAYGKDQTFLHVSFPGLEKLRMKFNIRGIAEINDGEIKNMLNSPTLQKRIGTMANIIKEKVKTLVARDPAPDLLVLAYPESVDEYCIEAAVGLRNTVKKTSIEKDIEKKVKTHKTLDLFYPELVNERKEEFKSLELRSIVKSICMDYDIPIQILRPHTTAPYNTDKPRREDDATTFWNLVVAIFYKSNHIPWRAKGIDEDTCYLGISFFREKNDPSQIKTTLAQMFSLDLDGFVFKGDAAIRDEINRSLHVAKNDSTRLMREAIQAYKDSKNGVLPKRVVIHKTSKFSDEEKEGFLAGVTEGIKVDLVALGTRDIKLIRWGKHPPVRGTMVKLPDQSILLYTFGYIPYLGTYPGPRVPAPLEILQHIGSATKEDICKEILALTKLNWNNAKFCSKAPITIAFARRVGAILRERSSFAPKNKFKFYI